MVRRNRNKKDREAPFFAAYVGPSMNPTLREPEIMEIMPYGDRPVRVGDVVHFLPSGVDLPVVHRVAGVSPAGISTCGDNNCQVDACLVQPENIYGQVVAAWRGQKRRAIAGGWSGRLANRQRRWHRAVDHTISPLLHPLYRALSDRRWVARLLPVSLRPRVVAFHSHGRDLSLLLMGKRIIGRFDSHRDQWLIQRPFHLFLEGRSLPSKQDRDRVNRNSLAECSQPRSPLSMPTVRRTLALADGSRWEISAGDEEASAIVSQLAQAMQMDETSGSTTSSSLTKPCRLHVRVDAHSAVADCYVPLASANGGAVTCILSPSEQWGGPFVNLVRLSLIFAREAQYRGGVLIHGALAEKDGLGVILAAPGGTGKTTASNRLPAPWRSLCDDTTLVVRDRHGRYRAHPWPTWSRFQNGAPGGSWEVQRAVALRGIFILTQANKDSSQRVGPGQGVSLLVECVRQASQFMPLGLLKEEVRALNLERFTNLCAVTQETPAHLLHLSLTGTFWHQIERALAEESP